MPSNGTVFLKGNKGYAYGYLINTSELRGGSRIPRRRGRQPSRGAPTYDFAEFCEKLHEIEKILGRGEGGGRGTPA